MYCTHNPIHCIVPPYVIRHMAESDDPKTRKQAMDAIAADAEARTMRAILATMPRMSAIPSPAGRKHRLIYDLKNKSPGFLPGKLVRSEGERRGQDAAVNEAFDGSGHVYDFYKKVFDRNSLDDHGMSLISTVHVGRNYNNAFWNGEQMAYGDGDGRTFVRFTRSLDVIGHELTHGVIAHTANLEYRNQPGALNEHFADVFGTLVKQWRRKQAARRADWLIGAEIMGPGTSAKALRTMKAEKAYENDPLLGTDQQPKHMDNFYNGFDDNGGVHINSGIPNHAFYLVATKLGRYAWTKAGRIWFETLRQLNSFSEFQEAAETTYRIARALYGSRCTEAKAVRDGWKAVGIVV